MNITSKFIYAKTKAAFEAQIPNIPEGLNPVVFIEDTREMWTCGTYFSIGYPGIQVSEESGLVKVQIGNTNFTLQTSGESLSIRRASGNDIVISSNALSEVNTEPPLSWDPLDRKLTHEESGAAPGIFGQSANVENASIFHIPYITTDKWGHIIDSSSKVVSIRDYVEQLAPTSESVDRNILLSYNSASNDPNTAQIRKAMGLLFNDATGLLKVPGGAHIVGDSEVTGDFTVKDGEIIGNLRGNVTGEATPKIHLSDEPEYGGASLNLYGHVKLQDDLTTEPAPSDDNADPASSTVEFGVAASPKMVWDAKQDVLEDIANKPSIGGIDVGLESVEITIANQRLQVSGAGGVDVSILGGGLIVSGPSISGYAENEDEVQVQNLRLGKDFVIANSEAAIRWIEIES